MNANNSVGMADQALIGAATSFTATLFIGRGEFAKHPTATLKEARAVGLTMAEHYKNGRKPMVYAHTQDGRQIFVPDTFKEDTMTIETDTANGADTAAASTAAPTDTTHAPKTYNKRFNAQRAAKVVLGQEAQEGAQFITEKAGGEWVWNAVPQASMPAAVTPDDDIIVTPPDFSAKTHERYRGKLATVVALTKARDIEGLRNFHINPNSSSPKAIMRYRDKAIAALESLQS